MLPIRKLGPKIATIAADAVSWAGGRGECPAAAWVAPPARMLGARSLQCRACWPAAGCRCRPSICPLALERRCRPATAQPQDPRDRCPTHSLPPPTGAAHRVCPLPRGAAGHQALCQPRAAAPIRRVDARVRRVRLSLPAACCRLPPRAALLARGARPGATVGCTVPGPAPFPSPTTTLYSLSSDQHCHIPRIHWLPMQCPETPALGKAHRRRQVRNAPSSGRPAATSSAARAASRNARSPGVGQLAFRLL